MPFRNVTELTEKGWITARRVVRPPGEKPLMTNAELDNFQRNIQYEWEVRKMSRRAILAILAEGVEPQQILAMYAEGPVEVEQQETEVPAQEMEVPEPLNVQPPAIPTPAQEPEQLKARPPVTPPPAHLLKEQGSARQRIITRDRTISTETYKI